MSDDLRTANNERLEWCMEEAKRLKAVNAELLAACKAFVAWFDTDIRTEDKPAFAGDIIGPARAAIASAEMGTPTNPVDGRSSAE